MFRPINSMLARSILLVVLLLSVSAMAQFEVSPDHFDSPSKPATARRAATKSQTKHKALASAQATGRHAARTATTANAHASTKKTQPKTTAALDSSKLN